MVSEIWSLRLLAHKDSQVARFSVDQTVQT